MGLGFPRVVAWALLGLSLAACAHGDFCIDNTPWAFAPRWDCGAETHPFGCPGAEVEREPLRFTQSQMIVKGDQDTISFLTVGLLEDLHRSAPSEFVPNLYALFMPETELWWQEVDDWLARRQPKFGGGLQARRAASKK